MRKSLKSVLIIAGFSAFLMGASGDGCDDSPAQPTADQIARDKQEVLNKEAESQCGMPNIVNFTDKKLMKLILEKRDQAKLVTYTYIVAENTGQLIYLGQSFGYGLPYATQYTNPQKIEASYTSSQAAAYATLPQADPNGLFSPASADGTWILMADPRNPSADPSPVYIEPRIIVSPFPLNGAPVPQATGR